MKTLNQYRKSILFSGLLLLAGLASATAQVTFNFGAPSISGSGANLTARYSNIATLPDGTVLDMFASVESQSDTSTHLFTWKNGSQNDNINSTKAFKFQLYQGSVSNGTVTWARVRYDFVKTGTLTPVMLDSVSYETTDLDHYSPRTEYFSATGFTSYQVNKPTNLTVNLDGDTLTAVGGANQSGEPTSAIRVNWQDVSGFTILYKLKRNNYSGTQRAGFVGGDADVGFTSLADPEVGDTVWNDTNENGVQDAGESGISGVNAYLHAADGTLLDQDTTNGGGKYKLSSDHDGLVYILFDSVSGMIPTIPNQGGNAHKDSDISRLTFRTPDFRLAPGMQPQWDAGFITEPDGANLVVKVLEDTDADGNGNDPIANAKVAIYITSGIISPAVGGSMTALTDSAGQVTFTNVPKGAYKVVVDAETVGDKVTPVADPDGVSSPFLAEVNLIGPSVEEFVFEQGFTIGSQLYFTYRFTNEESVPVTAAFESQMPSGVEIDPEYTPLNIGQLGMTGMQYTNGMTGTSIDEVVVPPGESSITFRSMPLEVHGELTVTASIDTIENTDKGFRPMRFDKPAGINVPPPPADVIPPLVSIFAPDENVSDNFPVTVMFSEPVTGFAPGDLTLSNGSIANFTGSGSQYSFEVAPANDGPVTVFAAYGAATDEAGNASTSSNLLTVVYTAPVYNPPTFVNVDFENGLEGFSYKDNTFYNTYQGYYASGKYASHYGKNSTAGVRVKVGGVNGADITNMSGGYSVTFNVASTTNATLSFDSYFSMSSSYESYEYSKILVSVDGQLRGNGSNSYVFRNYDGGTRGWTSDSISLGTLQPGTHTVTIGLFNNQKTTSSEATYLYLDNIIIE